MYFTLLSFCFLGVGVLTVTDNIFTIIQETLKKHEDIIISVHMLTLYVYGLHYYEVLLSNENENLLVSHINFCVSHLANHNYIKFNTIERQKFFPTFDNNKAAVEYFFEHNQKVLKSHDRFIGLLKDCCSAEEVLDFCNYLRENLNKQEPVLFDEDKTKFNRYIARKIRDATEQNNAKVYQDIFKLLPLRYICLRQPTVTRSSYGTLLIFNDKKGKFLFYAVDEGNLSSKTPEANVLVELEILKKTPNGYAEQWRWKDVEPSAIKETYQTNGQKSLDAALREWRDKKAKEKNIKPYEVIDDYELNYLVTNKPVTKGALSSRPYDNNMKDEIINIIRKSIYFN